MSDGPYDLDVGDDSDSVTAVRALLDAAGIAGRRLRTLVRLLTERPHTLVSLIQKSTVDRRTVEAVLAAIGPDLVTTGGRLRIAEGRTNDFRELIDYPRLVETEPADPLAHRLAQHADLVAQVRRWIEEAPGPRESLDHVSATAETAVRRALWLDSTFDLDGARLLCVGDHDLTSLAVAKVNPRVAITVVDVDDATLGHIDSMKCPSIRCLWTDFRFGLAAGAHEWSDLVFTDPPYTPEGVKLFLARALEGLRDRDRSRLVVAYGFGENHPTLGLKVQQAVAGLHLAYEAILPHFNRYHGAQAVGSSSDLHVLRPTTRTWKALDGAGREAVNIYTHGAQSLEGGSGDLAPDVASAVTTAAAGPADIPVAWVGPGWPSAEPVPLRAVFAGHPPAGPTRSAVAVNLAGDPGGWLPRLLLAIDVPRVALLVPNNHPDLTSAAAQRQLTNLVAPKYRLRLRRSTPGPRLAIVEAERVDEGDLDPAQAVARGIIDRSHGKVGNTWREALIRAMGARGITLTKNDARARIRSVATSPEALEEQLISLPRHRIAMVLREATESGHAAPLEGSQPHSVDHRRGCGSTHSWAAGPVW